MKQLIRNIILATVFCCINFSCAEETGMLGITNDNDNLNTSVDIFDVTTRSIEMGRVIAESANAYLGRICDPETGSMITASCAAQFGCLEDYTLPSKEQMVANEDNSWCDSCEVRIYLQDFYGDGNNPMKLEVFMLSPDKILKEDQTYYSDINLEEYLDEDAKPLATKVFTAKDYGLLANESSSSGSSSNIRVMLPNSLGQKILEKYYENNKDFSNSFDFVHNVFPGLYFRISQGEGTMLTTMVDVINIYYDYQVDLEKDSVARGITRFAATPEVIQSTSITNKNLDKLLTETSHTYIKTPAGICTEMTLPISNVFDKHPNDSVSLAGITLYKYNKTQDEYQLGTPKKLLMVRKELMTKFFEERMSIDNKTSFIASFNTANNTYEYANIGRLLSYCNSEKNNAVRDSLNNTDFMARHPHMTFETYEPIWRQEHEDWDKVVLIPVVTSTNSSNAITNISYDLSISSVKLVGGDEKLKMQVIYSRFE